MTQMLHFNEIEANLEMRSGGPLRFAVISASSTLLNWETACIDALESSGEAVLKLVLVASSVVKPKAGGQAAWVYDKVHRWACGALRFGNGTYAVPIRPSEQFDPMISSDIDFILSFVSPERFRSGVTVPPLGIWWFRFGGADHDNGHLPLSWAIAENHTTLHHELLAEFPGDEGVRILNRSVLKPRRTHYAALQQLGELGPSLCLGACRRIRLRDNSVFEAGLRDAKFSYPPVWRLVGGQIKTALSKFLMKYFRTDIWSIGVIDLPVDRLLEGAALPLPRWLEPSIPGQFYADPFPVSLNGCDHLLFEVYDGTDGRGWIATLEMDSFDNLDPAGKSHVMQADCHMSYPFVFEYEGETFCTPEMSELGGLNIFRFSKADGRWVPAASVMQSLPLIDPTLFEHGGRWWLFGTLEGSRSDTDLYAWFADNPFGPWTPHQLNPIKSDVRSARPAGAVFRSKGQLFRPAQDCTKGYGDAVVINCITHLDPTDFFETEALRVVPSPDWKWSEGLHTLNAWNGRIIIDAKRREFQLPRVLRGIRRGK